MRSYDVVEFRAPLQASSGRRPRPRAPRCWCARSPPASATATSTSGTATTTSAAARAERCGARPGPAHHPGPRDRRRGGGAGPRGRGRQGRRPPRDLSLDRLRQLRGLPRAARSISATGRASLGIQRPGGFSDHVLVPHPRYLLDFGGLTPEQAAPYACSGLTAFWRARSGRRGGLSREPVLLIGAGGLGLMAMAVLKALGGQGAVVADIDPKEARGRARGAARWRPSTPRAPTR